VGREQHKPAMMPGITAGNNARLLLPPFVVCELQNVKVATVGNFILVAVLWRQLNGSLELGV